ncbi:MAG TPA: isoleucine--tRNA ligase [Candidatus Woesebacteria bacterium]|nr:isoleucine--tRNA ligase [Candidatus Woesebacteria bacterium]
MSKIIKPLESQYVPSQIEEEVIEYWKKNQTFEKSVSSRDPQNTYRFYDGPPFVTGKPHYGHLLGSIIKDVIPRYQTMKGKHVDRVWGWDCHGLPTENKVEQQLGINSKKEIETLGIDKFVSTCKTYVNDVSADWQWYIDRIGRWVDMDHPYSTMDINFMESVIWVFKQLYDKGHIYEGKRVSLFCPRCSTPISNFEVAMDNSYKDVTDPSVFIKFPVIGESNTFFLAWTTTPWTLPSNFALAVSEKDNYVLAELDGTRYILAKPRLDGALGHERVTILKEFKGSELVGKAYQPLYDYFTPNNADHHVYAADFVSMEDGTGIVHIAPGYGEDDTTLGKKHGLSMGESVDDTGTMDPKIKVAQGKYFKAADKYVIEDLVNRELLLKSTKITHSYPHCHRCGTALLYKSQIAWYINIQDIKNRLLETNQEINWVPSHFKNGRFKLSIEAAPDWCISRSRYFGTPIPVWKCECGEQIVPGSIEEIEKLSGQKVTDLHRPAIDEIVFNCPKCGKKAKRIPEILDGWIESASMPYAQVHYPFENVQKFKNSFPADFITEYTGQLRAWFYVTHVISNLLIDSEAFKNVVVSGVIMGSDGHKMSKSLGNFPDPKDSLQKLGGDALRLYLMGSSIVLGQDIIVSEEDWANELKTTLMLLWNSYKYFVSYASLENWEPKAEFVGKPGSLDRWILTRLDETAIEMDRNLSKYQIPKAVDALKKFVSDLSTWYIRRSRDRVGPSASDQADKEAAYTTMYIVFNVLFKIAAPIIPFISEYLYRHLTGNESVHLSDWPEVNNINVTDANLLHKMTLIRKISEMGNAERKNLAIPIKQALASITVTGDFDELIGESELLQLIKDELNVEEVILAKGNESVVYDIVITTDLKEKGLAREIIRSIQEARKQAGCRLDEKIELVLSDWPAQYEEDIKRKALVSNLVKGDELKVVRLG